MTAPWEHRNHTAIAGIGATPYYKRGESVPQTVNELAGKAIIAAAEDAGIDVRQIDGFAYYSNGGGGYGDPMETNSLIEALGIPEVRFTATLTGGGGGSAGVIGLAAAAIISGQADVVVAIMTCQQAKQRLGTIFAAMPPSAELSFIQPSGLAGPGHLQSMLIRRHMHLYGTTRDAFAEVAISTRQNALNRPTARMRTPLTREAYFAAPMIAEPLCLFDFTLETDGAIAVIVTSTQRARDLRQKPVLIRAVECGGERKWGRAFIWFNQDDDVFASSGHRSIARRLFPAAGLSPDDIDVALLYDHFTPMVVMQLEDYGFCSIGEGGPFVEGGAIRFDGGSIPVNTHGGNLSEGYIIGMTHVREGVEQLRGTAINQVKDAKFALVTGGPASLPVSGLILGRDN